MGNFVSGVLRRVSGDTSSSIIVPKKGSNSSSEDLSRCRQPQINRDMNVDEKLLTNDEDAINCEVYFFRRGLKLVTMKPPLI